MPWLNRQAQHLKHLWTSEREKWFLVEVKLPPPENLTAYAIHSTEGDCLKIDSVDLYEYVIEQMKKAGVKIYSLEEWDG